MKARLDLSWLQIDLLFYTARYLWSDFVGDITAWRKGLTHEQRETLRASRAAMAASEMARREERYAIGGGRGAAGPAPYMCRFDDSPPAPSINAAWLPPPAPPAVVQPAVEPTYDSTMFGWLRRGGT